MGRKPGRRSVRAGQYRRRHEPAGGDGTSHDTKTNVEAVSDDITAAPRSSAVRDATPSSLSAADIEFIKEMDAEPIAASHDDEESFTYTNDDAAAQSPSSTVGDATSATTDSDVDSDDEQYIHDKKAALQFVLTTGTHHITSRTAPPTLFPLAGRDPLVASAFNGWKSTRPFFCPRPPSPEPVGSHKGNIYVLRRSYDSRAPLTSLQMRMSVSLQRTLSFMLCSTERDVRATTSSTTWRSKASRLRRWRRG